MKAVVMEEVDNHFLCLQNTVAHYIATWTIMEICLAAERRPRVRVSMRWWEQNGIDLGKGDTWTEMDTEGEGEDDDEEGEAEGRMVLGG